MRSISRLADASINTVSKLLIDAGKFCADLHDREVRDVKASRVQCDEIWTFTAAKQKNVATMKKPVAGAGGPGIEVQVDGGGVHVAVRILEGDEAGDIDMHHHERYLQQLRVAHRLAEDVGRLPRLHPHDDGFLQGGVLRCFVGCCGRGI